MSEIETEIVDPDAPVRFIRLTVDGEEAAMIPWEEANAIANATGAVPKEELRELVDKARENGMDTTRDIDHRRWFAFANELEELLDV